MSVQRWHLYSPIMREESATGEWVAYADHERALAEARQDMALQYLVTDREQQEQEDAAYAKGRADAIREAIAAVKGLPRWRKDSADLQDTTAALRALLPEGDA